MNVLRRYFGLLWMFARLCVQDSAAYRMDFVFHIFATLFHVGTELVALWVIFSNTNSLAGWSPIEILALLGVFRVMLGVITLFIAPNMRQLMDDIRIGTLDFLLLKPINSQFFASTRRMIIWRLMDIAVGLLIAAFACWKMTGSIPASRVAFFVLLLAAGITVIYSFWLFLGTLAFWFTRITNIEMVFWNIFEAGRYPVQIYRPWVRWGLTYIIPLAFLTTFPASALVGKANPTGLAAAALVAAASLTLASLFWRYGVRHYSGASA